MHKLHTEIVYLLIYFHPQLVWDCLICLPDILSIFSLSDLLAHPNIDEIPYLLVVSLQSNRTLYNWIGFGVRGNGAKVPGSSKEFDESKLVRPPCRQLFQFSEEIVAHNLGIESCLNQSHLFPLFDKIWERKLPVQPLAGSVSVWLQRGREI